MENSDIKKEPPEEILSIIEVKEERIEEIDQSNTEIASKNSEEKHKGYFEPKIEAKDIIKYSKVQKKRKKAQKNEFSCELCNKRLSSKYNLKTHIASVHEKKKRVRKKPFQCDICCAYFCSKGVLNTHITSVHEGKKPFKCSSCNFGSVSNVCLNRHISSVHEGKRPFQCSICNKSFSEKGSLKKHISTVHEGQKFNCNI